MTFCSSGKRQSPLSPSSFQEPAPKRANFNSPPPPAADDHHLVSGLTKLPLPQSFPLRRTVSEPIHSSTEALNFDAPPPQFSQLPNSPAPISNVAQETLPYPNPPPLIHRTVSDPSPFSNGQVVAAATGTPPRPPRPRKSPGCGESTTNKRVKRMKERMREMSLWWNQVLREEEDDDDDAQSHNHTCHPNKEESESDMENPVGTSVVYSAVRVR